MTNIPYNNKTTAQKGTCLCNETIFFNETIFDLSLLSPFLPYPFNSSMFEVHKMTIAISDVILSLGYMSHFSC